MKKILTVALVAMLTAASLFAGVSFSGKFDQGYTFKFADSKTEINAYKEKEAKFVVKFADDNGVWTVGLKDTGALDSSNKWAANATVDVKKALAAKDIDLGDFGLKVSLGNNDKTIALSAYNDVTSNGYYKLKNNGKESVQLDASYKFVKVRAAVDPTGDKKSAVVSAQLDPVDGVSVTAAYARNGWIGDDYQADLIAQNVIGGAVKVDVAKLAGLDFALSFSAYDNFAMGDAKWKGQELDADGKPVKGKDGKEIAADYHAFKDTDTKYNSLAANINAGYGKVSGYVEFVMGMELAASSKTTMGLNASLAYAITDDFSVDAYANIGKLSDVSGSLKVGADASYTLAGVELALNGEYNLGKKAFSLTPRMVIVF